VQLAAQGRSKDQQRAWTDTLVRKDVFYAADAVLPVDFCDVRSCLVLVDVSHRNDDRETGEFCSHEGRHWHFPAAPSPSPLQLPIAAAHALRPHPAQGQGALHLQVRARAPRGSERVPRLLAPAGSCVGHQRAAAQLRVDVSAVSAGVGGKTRRSRIRTEHSDD